MTRPLTQSIVYCIFIAVLLLALTPPRAAAWPGGGRLVNGDFEQGDFTGWTADPNWTVRAGHPEYRGWQGGAFAWSGGQGEAATGRLRSNPFKLSQDGVRLLLAGWRAPKGGARSVWNYVTLNRAADGAELDRIYAPNTLTFTPATLDGRGHHGERVYLEAVDNANQEGWSMFCIDDIKTVRLSARPDPARLGRAGALVLENDVCRVEVDPAHGTIERLRDKTGGLELLTEPRLADNFKFSLPLPGAASPIDATDGNYIIGRAQTLTAHESAPGCLRLHWAGPLLSERGQAYKVGATMTLTLDGAALRIEFSLDNHTPYPIGEVWAPLLGGMTGLGTTLNAQQNTLLAFPFGAGLTTGDIFRTFGNFCDLGTPTPERFFPYASALPMYWSTGGGSLPQAWADFSSEQLGRGVYFGAHDPLARLKVLHLGLTPGIAAGRAGGDWPNAEELGDRPCGVTAGWVYFPYTKPGEPFTAAPTLVQAHSGDWRAAAPLYEQWLEAQSGLAPRAGDGLSAAWVSQQLDAPAFGELPAKAQAAKRNGASVLILDHWWAGQPEPGEPRLVPDPALGGWEGLAAALAECHRLGVRVILCAPLQPLSRNSAWYGEELKNYSVRNRWGVEEPASGRWARLSLGAPRVREALAQAAAQLARAGVDGLHVGSPFPAALDFNLHAGLPPDQAPWAGTLACLAGLKQAAQTAQPGFRLSAEDPWDRLADSVDAVWLDLPDPIIFRLLHPHARPVLTVNRSDAFAVVNNALLCSGRLRVTEPLDNVEMKDLAKYIQEAGRLRDAHPALRDGGELIAGTMAGLSPDDEPIAGRPAMVRIMGAPAWAVYRDPATGRRAAVLVNSGPTPASVTVEALGAPVTGSLKLRQPFQEAVAVALPITLTLPPGRLAVLGEE